MFTVAAIAGLSMACNGPAVASCDIFFDEQILNITTVRDASTGASIPRVWLRDMYLRGTRIADLRPFLDFAYGISLEGQELRCDVGCGFGADEGEYQFTVRANGYRDTTLVLNARYETRAGTCGRHFSDGVEITLSLRQQ